MKNDKKQFFDHLKENNDEDKNVFLKIDVEGAEYEFFENTDIEEFQKMLLVLCWKFIGLVMLMNIVQELPKF
jgi:hypothetical protein